MYYIFGLKIAAWHNSNLTLLSQHFWSIQQENGQESVPMASHEGKHYTCFLPVEETKTMKSILPQNATNVIIGSDRRIKPKEPDELLEPLKDHCFYRVSIQLFIYAPAHIMNYWPCACVPGGKILFIMP